MVLISPFVRQVKTNPLMQAVFWFMLNNPLRVRTWGMYYPSFYPTTKPPDFKNYMAQLIENLKEPGRFEAVKALGTSSRQPSEERMDQLKSPSLVIMGTKDPDFPASVAEGQIVAESICGALATYRWGGCIILLRPKCRKKRRLRCSISQSISSHENGKIRWRWPFVTNNMVIAT
jgi:hypothetical protein